MAEKTRQERYLEAMHAMQAGVAQEMEIDPHSTSAKHLRVGLNSTKSDAGALVSLLIKKGVFTEAEYEEELVVFMEREKKWYEQRLSELMGVTITLVGRSR